MIGFDGRLVSALVERGAISAGELAEAQIAAEESDKPLLETLIQLRYVGKDVVTEARALQLGMQYMRSVDPEEIDVELNATLPVSFAKSQLVLPLWLRNGVVEVAVVDPLNLEALDTLRLELGAPLEPVVMPEQTLLDAVNKVFDRRAAADAVVDQIEGEVVDGDVTDIELVDINDADDEAPIIRLVNAVLAQATKQRASDIHIEPFERYTAIRFRVDGVLQEITQPHKRFHAAITSRVKVMASLDIAEKRVPQDGRIKIKVSGKDIDIRLSTVPTSHGERIVMRLLDKTAVLQDLGHIGMAHRVLDNMNEMITQAHGIILVTGPTGSGKTTTLYACLAKINSPTRNIITTEDPVEYQLNGIGQIQVNTKVGLTFAAGLRAILRQDPDVVMVGEIRDKETAEIAIQASLTGHLVFSTLHTNDSAGAVSRLVDMGVEPFLVSSSVIGIMAQRLVRTMCGCKQPVVPTESELRQLGYDRERFLAETPGHVYAPQGCQECLDSGYRGRTGIYELMVMDDHIRALVMDNVDAGTIKKASISAGMTTLRDDGALKVMAGITSIAEVLRVTQDDMSSME